MGGLWRKLPITWVVMLMGRLALFGIAPFSRLYLQGRQSSGRLSRHIAPMALYGWILGTVTAGLTAFYTERRSCSPSTAPSRAPKHVQEHVHERDRQ